VHERYTHTAAREHTVAQHGLGVVRLRLEVFSHTHRRHTLARWVLQNRSGCANTARRYLLDGDPIALNIGSRRQVVGERFFEFAAQRLLV